MKLDYCLHTHTYRCGHARGADEDFVKAAIDIGIKTLGFSDHVFLPYHIQKTVRGDYTEFDGYLKSLSLLRDKYKDKIKLLIGFECEYFDEYIDYYRSLKKRGIDYLILGQHFFMNDGNLMYLRNSIEKEDVDRYFREVEKGIKSGVFTYFAHPDLYLTMKPSMDEQATEIAHKICKLSKEYNVPLEINLNGMTWTLPSTLTYPHEGFWKIVGEEGAPVVIGYDSHWPEFFKETKYVKKALEWVEKYNLNLLNKDEILKFIK